MKVKIRVLKIHMGAMGRCEKVNIVGKGGGGVIVTQIKWNEKTLFACLGLSSHSRIFHSYKDVTITGEGL